MPSASISINQLANVFASRGEAPVTISTQVGNIMIEIQGDLQHPTERAEAETDTEQRFIEQDGKDLVRFGILSYDFESKNATLFIGKKQRLLGKIVKLETPLALLHFKKSDGTVSLDDLIHYKIIFKSRPLPIM